MTTKTVTLTVEQWEEIKEAVEGYTVCGPIEEGFKSPDMREAADALECALEKGGSVESARIPPMKDVGICFCNDLCNNHRLGQENPKGDGMLYEVRPEMQINGLDWHSLIYR